MSENKTREDIISEHSPHGEYNHYYHEHAILEMLTEFADQEKRSTAIAFAVWLVGRYEKQRFFANDNRWHPVGNRVFDTALLKTSDELYDLFINSL